MKKKLSLNGIKLPQRKSNQRFVELNKNKYFNSTDIITIYQWVLLYC